MPKTSKTTVHTNSRGDYQTTIPKGLGDALRLGGIWLEWTLTSDSRFELHQHDDDPNGPGTTATKVNRNSNGQYQTTVPKDLGNALRLEGQTLNWQPPEGRTLPVVIQNG